MSKKYEIKRIMRVEHLGVSALGNSYYNVIFDDLTEARTRINGSVNIGIENSDLRDRAVAIFTTRAGRIWDIVPVLNLPDGTKYRWIVYLHHPQGGFGIDRALSLRDAEEILRRYSRDTFVYEQATASLYPYSEEDWEEAKEYEEIGCPFDYPSKVLSFGPKGGIKVENA